MVCKMATETAAASPPGDSDTLDLSDQAIEKLARATPEVILNTTTLILDNNCLTRLDNIYTYQCLEKLSVSNNKLVRMFQVSKLQHLKVLDLSRNSIVTIEGLKDIKLLTWLSLAGNLIKSIENLQNNILLEHLDLSANQISYVSNISCLKHLKTLLLHNNKIGTLRSFSEFVPPSVTTLTLSDNQLLELGDVCHLAHLSKLDQLTLANNPAIQQPEQIQKQFDYRPYVINWCLSLRMLDGILVGAKESLKAEWMYSQSKGRQFGPGEQEGLVEYLVQTCPLDPDQETEQDRKLSLILSKVQEHQSSLRNPRCEGNSSTLPRSHSGEGRASAPSTPRRNSGPLQLSSEAAGPLVSPAIASTPSSAISTPVNTPGVVRRNSAGPRTGSRYGRTRTSPSPTPTRRIPTPSQYNLELPPTLYGEDLLNGNNLMTQSMDPSFLSSRLDNTHSDLELMSQSVDATMLRENLNERFGQGSASRPRTLFSQRGSSSDSGIRSEGGCELVDLSDSECGSVLAPIYSRLQSRLNPVPESLNSPDIVPGPSPPRRDDPLHSGPLGSLPHDLELRLRETRNAPQQPKGEPVHSSNASSLTSPRSLGQQTSPRPSDVMVAAVSARIASTPKTPVGSVLTRPTSAVKPVNVNSKVDSGLARSGWQPSRPRSQSAGPAGSGRKSSLPNRQVAALRSAEPPPPSTPEVSRKRVLPHPLSLADDEASDTENEQQRHGSRSLPTAVCRPTSKPAEPPSNCRDRSAPGSRRSNNNHTADSVGRGSLRRSGGNSDAMWRNTLERRNNAVNSEQQQLWRNGPARTTTEQMTKSVSSLQMSSCSRPRSTSLTRSQSARLGRGGGGGGVTDRSLPRPRSSTLSTPPTRGGLEMSSAARSIQATWRGHVTRARDPQVREVQEELRSARLEAHVKQLTKELRNARAALDQERKLRKVQSDTIKVLWKEIQTLHVEEAYDFDHVESLSRHEMRKSLNKKTMRKGGRLLRQEDSDSSRGDELACELGSGSSTSGVDERSVAELSRTCESLQSQVEQLQANLASVVRYVSERSRHSSSSQGTPPPPPTSLLPSSMTMSLPPSLALPPPVTVSRSCDSLAQTDIVAVKTPQTEGYAFLANRHAAYTDVDTSDSDLTRMDGELGTFGSPTTSSSLHHQHHSNHQATPPCSLSPHPTPPQGLTPHPSPPRARSPRPVTLPGVGVGPEVEAAAPKRAPPPGSDIPGMICQEIVESPPGPRLLRTFATSLVETIICQTKHQVYQKILVPNAGPGTTAGELPHTDSQPTAGTETLPETSSDQS